MSLPIPRVGPLKVEPNPILMESAAIAGVASARAVTPASQNAVLIFVPSSLSTYTASQMTLGLSFLREVSCARNRALAASTNPRVHLRTFGSCDLHHSSQPARM